MTAAPATRTPVAIQVAPPVEGPAPAANDPVAQSGDGAPDSGAEFGMLAHQVLVTCGPGRILEVGCGRGGLVRALLNEGVDATGLDADERALAHARTLAPDRFIHGSVLALPFPDASFDTVVCSGAGHGLERLADSDVQRAMLELARVARRAVFITVFADAPDAARSREPRTREWWEHAALTAGGGVLRKHPLASTVLSYESLERSDGDVTLIFERLPAAAAARYPVESLESARGLHMDMLREAGRSSDAHIARYALAATFVRRDDRVLDAACGLGSGAAVLAAASPLQRVIGIDNDPAAVGYARDNFGSPTRLEFVEGDCHELSSVADNAIDTLVSFETLAHVRDADAVLTQAARVLRPAGRLIVSVPNDWTDHTGRDPNPHHLHVYTWQTLSRQLRDHGFEIERAFAQTAGAGMKLAEHPRRISPVSVEPDGSLSCSAANTPAEWWIVVAMKPATGEPARHVPFAVADDATTSRRNETTFNPLAFGRDYDNPWLADALVTIGHRATDARMLQSIALRTLVEAAPDSADAGAALCVLGYRLLEQPSPAAEVEALLARLAAFDAAAEPRGASVPHVHRWGISNRFIAARLLLSIGRRPDAREMFLRCAELDPTAFSPLLAGTTVESLFHAGLLAAGDGDLVAARRAWERGLTETRRALSGDWYQIWRSHASPAPFSLPEVAVLADAAAMCAAGLIGLADWAERPGAVWRTLRAGTKSDLRGWIAHLESQRGAIASPVAPVSDSQNWLAAQVANWRAAAEARERDINELKRWCDQLTQGKAWLESKLHESEAEAARRAADYEQARAWLKGQIDNWRTETARRDQAIAELKTWTDQLETAKRWLVEELERAQSRIGEAERRAAAAADAARDAAAQDASAEVGRRAVEFGAQINSLRTANQDAAETIRALRDEQHDLKAIIAGKNAWIHAMHTPSGLLKTIGRIITGRRPTP